jgi:zinc protease
VLPVLDAAFGVWKAPAAARGNKSVPEPQAGPGRIVLVDRPGSPQTMLVAGRLAPPTGVDNNLAIEVMNDAIGGQFTSRINMNLREDKGWAYVARTLLPDARGPRPFLVFAPVQTDKTAPSILEVLEELRDYVGKRPITEVELERNVKNLARSLPGEYETQGNVLGAMLDNARFGRPDDYVATLSSAYRALTRADAEAAARQVIHPDQLVWLVVGDREVIQPEIERLGLGELEVLKTP